MSLRKQKNKQSPQELAERNERRSQQEWGTQQAPQRQSQEPSGFETSSDSPYPQMDIPGARPFRGPSDAQISKQRTDALKAGKKLEGSNGGQWGDQITKPHVENPLWEELEGSQEDQSRSMAPEPCSEHDFYLLNDNYMACRLCKKIQPLNAPLGAVKPEVDNVGDGTYETYNQRIAKVSDIENKPLHDEHVKQFEEQNKVGVVLDGIVGALASMDEIGDKAVEGLKTKVTEPSLPVHNNYVKRMINESKISQAEVQFLFDKLGKTVTKGDVDTYLEAD